MSTSFELLVLYREEVMQSAFHASQRGNVLDSLQVVDRRRLLDDGRGIPEAERH